MNSVARSLLAVISCATCSLQAADLPLAAHSIRFAVIGDMGTGQRPQYEVADQMNQMRMTTSFDFVIMVGDDIYGRKSGADFDKKFAQPYANLLQAGVNFYASLGNHDVPAEEYYKPFHMDGRRYYDFDRGDVRFFALDSDYMDPDQVKWLTEELNNSKAAWKIPFFHHPLYSSGIAHGSSLELRKILEPIFVEYGVHVVFSGHDHIYERTKPQQGITYFVEGSSGELRPEGLRSADFEAAGFDRDRTFMIVEIAGDKLFFETISRTGTEIDSGTITTAG